MRQKRGVEGDSHVEFGMVGGGRGNEEWRLEIL